MSVRRGPLLFQEQDLWPRAPKRRSGKLSVGSGPHIQRFTRRNPRLLSTASKVSLVGRPL